MLIFHSFKASGSTFSHLHHRLLKSFKEAAISLRHLEKSILEGNLYLGPLEMILRTLASGMTLRLPVYRRPYWFVIFITNDRSFRIIMVIWNR